MVAILGIASIAPLVEPMKRPFNVLLVQKGGILPGEFALKDGLLEIQIHQRSPFLDHLHQGIVVGGSAAKADDEVLFTDDRLQHLDLQLLEGFLTESAVKRSNRLTDLPFNLPVKVIPPAAQPLGKQLSDRGFSAVLDSQRKMWLISILEQLDPG